MPSSWGTPGFLGETPPSLDSGPSLASIPYPAAGMRTLSGLSPGASVIGGVDIRGSEKQKCSLEGHRIHLLGDGGGGWGGHKCSE